MKNFIFILFIFISCTMFSQNEETISSGNSKLHFKTVGKGKPLLLINGGPGMNSEGFAKIAEELSKFNFQIITYDQRGTGQSTIEKINSETITMDLMVDDIENLRKYLKINKWTILGHSFGGVLATYYTTIHPEHIDKLVFSSSGGVNLKFTRYVSQRMNDNLEEQQRDSLSLYQNKMSNGDSSKTTLIKWANILSNAYVFDKSNAPLIAKRLTQINFTINALVYESLTKINFNCTDKFSNFNKSVLVLQGKNDIISIETAEEIAKAFPKSKLILMENCGHYGWLDAKKTYLKAIKNFLND